MAMKPMLLLARERSIDVDVAHDGHEALTKLKNNDPYSCIISDYMLGPNHLDEELDNGAYLLSKAAEMSPETTTVLYTMSSVAIERSAGSIDKGFLKQTTNFMAVIDWIVAHRKGEDSN
ncbi:MAG: hypothetical protein OIF51_09760 [Cellvibrionaceae bacterium]|nr:hypothetical protein [Cellvibrionaceae bacterium]